MATRWRCCSRGASIAGALAVGAACTTQVTRFYLPGGEQPRAGVEAIRHRLNALLAIECPRLLAGRMLADGAATLRLTVDTTGEVRRVELRRATGDARLDDIIGGVVADLTLPPVPERTERTAVVQYSCSNTAAVATIDLGPPR